MGLNGGVRLLKSNPIIRFDVQNFKYLSCSTSGRIRLKNLEEEQKNQILKRSSSPQIAANTLSVADLGIPDKVSIELHN